MGDQATRAALEDAIREHASAGRFEEAATTALKGYGGELLGYLHAVAPSPSDADDVFSDLCEAVWRQLPNFGFRSSFRTWAYSVARNLLRDHRRAANRRRRRIATSGAVSQIADEIRSSTPQHLKSTAKSKLQLLREALEPDDRTLLVLRIDRGLSWNEIAIVLAEDEPDEADIPRLSARARKRFERIKARLTELMAAT